MRGTETLIPARFLTLIGHFCILITLLWESHQSIQHCLPRPYHDNHFHLYHRRLVTGYASSVALLLLELLTFLFGLTMFSPSVSLLSIGGHGLGTLALTYFILDGWLCDWFWLIFFFCSVVPSVIDTTTALLNVCQNKW